MTKESQVSDGWPAFESEPEEDQNLVSPPSRARAPLKSSAALNKRSRKDEISKSYKQRPKKYKCLFCDKSFLKP